MELSHYQGKPIKEVIEIQFDDKTQLYAAHMSFLNRGGIFIPTTRTYHLGDILLLRIRLPEQLEKDEVIAEVVWITPLAAQDGLAPGIGVKLIDEKGDVVYKQITTILAGMLQSEDRTDTM